jgi:PAS domain S-box-containing protein
MRLKKYAGEESGKQILQPENELIQNRENIMFKNILNGISTPVSVIDIEGKILYANSAFCRFFIIGADSFTGRNFFQLMPSDSHGSLQEVCNTAVNTGRIIPIEEYYNNLHIQARISPITRDGASELQKPLIMVEISVHLTTELELKKNEEKYQMFFSNLTEAISLHKMITDDNGNIIDFTYEAVNPARERLINLKFSELKNKTLKKVNPDLEDRIINEYGSVAITGKPVDFEYYTKTFHKHLKVKVFSPNYGYAATIIEDVSAQKKAEELLNRTLEKYRTIFENSVEGIILVDDAGTITEWNKYLENKTGLDKLKVIGKKIWDIQHNLMTEDLKKKFPDDTLRKIWLNIMETLAENETFTREGKFLDKNGNLVMTEDLLCPIRLNDEKFICIIQHDLTERRTAENELRVNEQKLREVNATKDKLFSIIAHDLRSPFNLIIGYSRDLMGNIRKYKIEDVEKFVEIINSSAQNTLNLLINLLSWAKNQTGQTIFNPENLDLRHIISEVIDFLISSARIKDITINHDMTEKIMIYADKNMLKTILQNLISNAVKFTRPGGNIKIYTISFSDHLEITVSDNGVGLSKKVIRNLLAHQTNTPSAGTFSETGSGLGLVICREFIEKHGGKIWVESRVGKGSDFKFTFPLIN